MTVSHRPTPAASGAALLVAAVTTATLARGFGQRLAIVGTLVGVGLFVASGRPSPVPLPPGLLTAAGSAVVVASIGWALTTVSALGARYELLPGLAGVVLIGLGVRPVRQRFARRFASAGLAALLVGVALAGIFERAGPIQLLVATAGAIVAWDLAEHAISLGEQLRPDAATTGVELLHGGVTAAYSGLLVVVATVLYGSGTATLPLGGVALLLVAALALLALLYR